ncbi:hypothetical protein ACFSJY_10815 [Thalassotalea euphylliae]|uniref:hypothetical protein n=1 Tax=Thalassotalea euphylliae TaxID=1655234 RepID=UPI00363A8014
MLSRFIIKFLILGALGTVAFTFYIRHYGENIDSRLSIKEMTFEEFELHRAKQIADYVVNESKQLQHKIATSSPFSDEKEQIAEFDIPALTDADRACNKAITAYFSDKSAEAKARKDKACAHNK